jgi:pimeloyl-ACP methyl ester carboxylesterase
MNSGTYTLNYKNATIELAYFIRPGNDKTLLYLHGGACSSEDFLQATKREELKSYTIVRFDFPGCGTSSYAEHEPLDIDDLVEITRNII